LLKKNPFDNIFRIKKREKMFTSTSSRFNKNKDIFSGFFYSRLIASLASASLKS